MAKIKSNVWQDRDIILPVVGKVHFDKDGVVEVKDAKQAEEVCAAEGLDLEVVDSEKSSNLSNKKGKAINLMNKTELMAEVVLMGRDKGEDISDKKKDELKDIINMSQEDWDAVNPTEEGTEEGKELSKEEKIDYINSLDKAAALKELCTAFNEEEWKGMRSKAQLKEYLIGKIE